MITKEQLLKKYAEATARDPKNALRQEQAFLRLQRLGDIPKDVEFSLDALADYDVARINAVIAQPGDNQVTFGQYLNDIKLRESLIEVQENRGSRPDLYNRWIKSGLPSGFSYEIQYQQLGEVKGYDRMNFIPTDYNGGELFKSQLVTVSQDQNKDTNKDLQQQDYTYPSYELLLAELPPITDGMSAGFPARFMTILDETWAKFEFDRHRETLSLLGTVPQGVAKSTGTGWSVLPSEWFGTGQVYKANPSSFIGLDNITDVDSVQNVAEAIYAKVAELEGNYSADYNAAGIMQISAQSDMSIIFDSTIKSKLTRVNSILFNYGAINPELKFKSLTWVSLPDPKVKPADYGKPLAILFIDKAGQPIIEHRTINSYNHQYITPYDNGAYRIRENRSYLTGINHSVNVIIFYQKTANKETNKKAGK